MKKHYLVLFFLLISTVGVNAQDFNWVKNLRGTCGINSYSGIAYSTDIIFDRQKNIYVTGLLRDTVDFDPGPDSTYLITPRNITYFDREEIYLAKYDSNGTFRWANLIRLKQYGWGNNPIISVDANNDIYLTGSYPGPADFDPGPAEVLLSNNIDPTKGYSFFAKYDSSGSLLWAKVLGAGFIGFTRDEQNNIYVVGNFMDSLDADPGASKAMIYTNSVGIFYAKYDKDGHYIWAKVIPNVGGSGWSISIQYDKGAIVISGGFEKTVDFDPSSNVAALTATSLEADMFLAKYDTVGNYLWVTKMNEIFRFQYMSPICLAIDNQSNIVVSSNFNSYVNFSGNGNNFLLMGKQYWSNFFIAKYGQEGNLLWAKAVENPDVSDMDIDAKNNIYISGHFYEGADFDPGPAFHPLYQNMNGAQNFFAKYDTDGNYLWVEPFAIVGLSYPVIKVDEYSQYLSGTCKSYYSDFDPSPNVVMIPGCGTTGYIAKYSSPSLTNIQSIRNFSRLLVYPNPASETFTIQLPVAASPKSQITITDVTGREVFSKNISKDKLTVINVSTFSKGIYFIELRDDKQFYRNQVIRE